MRGLVTESRLELPSAAADMNPIVIIRINCIVDSIKKPPFKWEVKYRRADLNCRPSGYESDALTS